LHKLVASSGEEVEMRRDRVHMNLHNDVTFSAGAPERLYGRERELELLDRLLEVGEGGQSLVVRGDAGVGKSALLAELSRRAAHPCDVSRALRFAPAADARRVAES
jgi:predicted ATP-dependent serine protease